MTSKYLSERRRKRIKRDSGLAHLLRPLHRVDVGIAKFHPTGSLPFSWRTQCPVTWILSFGTGPVWNLCLTFNCFNYFNSIYICKFLGRRCVAGPSFVVRWTPSSSIRTSSDLVYPAGLHHYLAMGVIAEEAVQAVSLLLRHHRLRLRPPPTRQIRPYPLPLLRLTLSWTLEGILRRALLVSIAPLTSKRTAIKWRPYRPLYNRQADEKPPRKVFSLTLSPFIKQKI